MPLVRVKEKYQVTLPVKVRKRVGLNVGDLLEANVEKGKITLTPKLIIERRLAESFEDFKKGRVYGPFSSSEEMIRSLHESTRRRTKKSKRS